MSHNIQENDRVMATQPTWHKLETLFPQILFPNSGLNWAVETAPVFSQVGEAFQEIPGFQQVRRADTGLSLQVGQDSYQTVQNARIWEAMETALGKAGVDYEVTCSGSLGNCKKVFISVQLADSARVVNGDKF